MNKIILITLLLFVPLSYINAQTMELSVDEKPIINPIKGFKGWNTGWENTFDKKEVGLATTKRLYIPLDSLIKKVDGGYEVINDLKLTHYVKRSVSRELPSDKLNTLFKNNIKIIPRIVAHTDPGYKWFDDLNSSTYYKSQEFQDMLKFLIPKLVDKWDNDPNIAYVEMGLVGSYGEFVVQYLSFKEVFNQTTIDILTEEFSKFENKNVTTGGINGYPNTKDNNKTVLEYIPSTILSNKFGVSWDSFISMPQMEFYGLALDGETTASWTDNKQMNKNLWQIKPYVGEVAYNYGDRLGDIPYDNNNSLTDLRMKQSIEDPAMVDVLVESIKKYHMSDLSWISNYKKTDETKEGANKIHKALGYRFVIQDASYEINAKQGENIDISFNVSNVGSAPFYYKWPLVVSLIDKDFNVIFNSKTDIDITKWIEGDYANSINLEIPTNIPNGKYFIALSIQELNSPSLRFANINYFNGGYTPIGNIGINDEISNGKIDSSLFNKTDKDPKFNVYIPDDYNEQSTIVLNEGWNLMGIDADLTLLYLKEQLGDDNIISIQGSDDVYKASNHDSINNFNKFKQGVGYWIKLKNQKGLTYDINTNKESTIPLYIGWNQINPTSNLTLNDIIAQLGAGNLEAIQGDNKIYKKENSIDLNNFEAFKEPYGYWIKVNQASQLKFSDKEPRQLQKTSWHIQLQKEVDENLDAKVYIVDLFDTSASKIQSLKNKNKEVICYFNAGAYESWRQDAESFPAEILGDDLSGWEGEKWLDIRSEKLKPIIQKRLTYAKGIGCDGVDPDNVNGYINPTGFDLTYEDQLEYGKWLAKEANEKDLSIGLKNNLDQIIELEPLYDFAINEQCHQYNECDKLKPFIDANKTVYNIEYDLSKQDEICQSSKEKEFNTIITQTELDGTPYITCN